MNAEAFFFVQGNAPLTTFRDLDRVAITHAAMTDDGDTIPPGAEGTIVDVIQSGVAYAVEFSQPFGALATMLAGELRLVDPAGA